MDIVERLRQGVGHRQEDCIDAERCMDKAADEIERLMDDNGYMANALGKAEAEIERLQTIIDNIENLRDEYALKRNDENQRLRAELAAERERWAKVCEAEAARGLVERLRRYADDIRANGERSELDEAADEIERLQELLRGVGANRYWEGRWRDERERCIRAIWEWSGLTDDEKRIAETAIREFESVDTGVKPSELAARS